MPEDRIVAVGLLTERDVNALGPSFQRLWPVEDVPCFAELLDAIDEAERRSDPPAVPRAERSRATK